MTVEKADITFAVTATGPGNDQFTYQWIKEKDNFILNVTDEEYSPSFTISSVKLDNSGIYYCIVRNQWNITKKSNKAFLKVTCKCKI